jgi:hypothetical protein
MPDLSDPRRSRTYAPRMSHGRHSRPRARGGGLASLLALALAGGAVAVAVRAPSTTALRLCVIGGAAVGAVGLLLLARLQRTSSRSLARTEERLRVLELRSRDESEDLHRRVIEAVTREGELRYAVDVLSTEIARLRASLDGLAIPVEAAAASMAELVLTPAESTPMFDLPLVQRVFAEPLAEPFVADEPVYPPAGDLWQPPARPEQVPVESAGEVRSWVVRELQVDTSDTEPVAALTMRILDLRTPADARSADEEPEQLAAWGSFARPA